MRSKSVHLGGYKMENHAQKTYVWGSVAFHGSGEKNALPSISPLAFCTQLDEDFIGRVSSMSRMVSIRTVHERTLKKYQVALAAKW